MSSEAHSISLVAPVVLLAAAVIAVPIFKRIGLGSVLGYLIAGLIIGPFGFAFFQDSAAILHIAELGIVMYLFVIGLEMQPSHLWSLRREIFGLGTLQIIICALALTGVGLLFGFTWQVAFIGAAGFVLTSTAIVMQLLGDRGDLTQPRGQKIVAILLFEDLLIVPLLAIVAFMAPNHVVESTSVRLQNIGVGLVAIAGLIAAGYWLLNPLFRLLAAAKAREVMTAAALLVVLGAALLMQVSGLSMAMGAFLAGVLLSESTFRHQIEADIEPFRGILLGLFFLGVGMSLDLSVVAQNWQLIVSGVIALMFVKALMIYIVARITKSPHTEALDRALLMAQGGEFAFVLFSAALSAQVIDSTVKSNLTAIVVLSMVLTPIVGIIFKRFTQTKANVSLENVNVADGLSGSVLMIGFGRFGQVTSQLLLARGVDVTIIDNNIDMIQNAEKFGFKIYYGDGCRLDILHTSGAATAQAIVVCVDSKETTNRIVELVTHEFPLAKLLVRSYDREHSLHLVKQKVDFMIRETFESAIKFGEVILQELGVDEDEVVRISEEIRDLDNERFETEIAADDVYAGVGMQYTHAHHPRPTAPLIRPKQEGRILNKEDASDNESVN
ncbi:MULTISPECIES: monovalent cation:proton antiporter-2 (CPA2) family protein [Acinetobacter calcoaceticus/baumannii complex]|uniref:Monovalent cation:proton antiporter-2 (CPA2) family protein n=1 Tax=Acinetobacter lactucae TaxID=1785128 RepID=A0AB35K5R1_9GAMM|nr:MULTISPECIES: monovalent cation:proton antiporter-2 (CPA2) family protein [Acinetobacter calcoaceticus/baumannii complex]KQE95795.1 potassium transporter [Acinetobacter lactucae]MCG9491394.1 monovalent cation:proton antiporter-2 (CPA2) family protein [Acinetobacter pittii]MCU4707447.1 monovalent cation:proton antiporter-2 (CPA2) family protein [Acinetobacter pittii]MDD9317673.1 monovalent cation:proton antiporter-2 (CPA2) family protein [Acinetobacter lactucae]MDD9321801.1 monovalent cation